MYSAPPPIQHRKKSYAPLLIICGIGLIALIAFCAIGGNWVLQTVKKSPEARKGFGKPEKVRAMSGTWALYRLPEVPMTIEAPSKPLKLKIEFEKGSSLIIKDWISYEFESDLASYNMTGYWYRSKEFVDLDEEADSIVETFKEAAGSPSFKHTTKDSTIGNLTGKEVTATYDVKGEQVTMKSFCWAEKRAVFSINQSSWYVAQASAKKEFERILSSVTFEP